MTPLVSWPQKAISLSIATSTPTFIWQVSYHYYPTQNRKQTEIKSAFETAEEKFRVETGVKSAKERLMKQLDRGLCSALYNITEGLQRVHNRPSRQRPGVAHGTEGRVFCCSVWSIRREVKYSQYCN